MKIVIINVVYKVGSTGKNVDANYRDLKARGHEVKVFYGTRKQDVKDRNFIYIGSRIATHIHYKLSKYFGLQGSLSILPTLRMIHILKKFKPDIIWVNGIHGYYLCEPLFWKYVKLSKIWVVYGMPDEYGFVGKCCSAGECDKYKTECNNCPQLSNYPESKYIDNSKRIFRMKKRAYAGISNLIFRSAPYVISRAKQSALTTGKYFCETDSSVDVTNTFYYRGNNELREELCIPEKHRIVLSCAPYYDELKGVKYFYEAAKLLKEEEITFINVGYAGPNNRHLEIDTEGLKYIVIPYIADQNRLAEFYSIADVYVCTSIVDAMPNACLEALGCGTPILGFNISGVPFVADDAHGKFIEPCKAEVLAEEIMNHPKKTLETIQSCHNYALQRFDRSVSNARKSEFLGWIEEKIKQSKHMTSK